jgi:hypothetical protein
MNDVIVAPGRWPAPRQGGQRDRRLRALHPGRENTVREVGITAERVTDAIRIAVTVMGLELGT